MRRSLAAIVLCTALVGAGSGCGQAVGRSHARHDVHRSVASSPEDLLQAIVSKLNSPRIRSARLGAAPAGYEAQGPWIYVDVNHDGDASGLLGDFEALLIAGTYSREAPLQGQPGAEGVSYHDESSAGCRSSFEADACVGGEWRITLGVGTSAPPSTDPASLESKIRDRLRKLGLEPVTITFDRPQNNLVPIVVARISDLQTLPADNWQSIRQVAVGLDREFEGSYLELVDGDGAPVAATGVDAGLAIGISWRPQ